MDAPTDSPSIAALRVARNLLRRADDDTIALRTKIQALADATAWSARAADGYHAEMATLLGDLDALLRFIDNTDADLADAETSAACLAPSDLASGGLMSRGLMPLSTGRW